MATINGSGGDDTLDGTSGDDTIQGQAGNDSIDGGEGNDSIDSGDGRDTVHGGGGDDYVDGLDGDDSIEGGDGNDTLLGYVGDDTLKGGEGSDTLYGEQGADSLEGGAGNDDLFGGSEDDTLKGDAGDDWVMGGTGNDSMYGGTGHDTVAGEEGDDTIQGGDGDDTVSGHEGDDALHGGAGEDSLYGGSGEDYFDGGDGAENDYYYMDREDGGGDNDASQSDRDVVRFEPGMGHDTAYDFEGTNDYVYIGAQPESDVVITQISPTQWVLTFDGGSPDDSLTLNFADGTEPADENELRGQLLTEDEYTPPQDGNPAQWTPQCFTPNARILTDRGLRRIGSLRRGDLVVTADQGLCPVSDLLDSRYPAQALHRHPHLRPIVIERGCFGGGLPRARMVVSRQHAFAARGGTCLIRAAHLAEICGVARIQTNRPNRVRYIHLVLAEHALVQVEGVWTESFFCNPSNTDVPPGHHRPLPHHAKRCRPLLSRADLRRAPLDPGDLGRLDRVNCPPRSELILENATLHP